MSLVLPSQRNVGATLLGLFAYSGLLIYLVFFSNIDLFQAPNKAVDIIVGERHLGGFESLPPVNSESWEQINLPDDWRTQSLTSADAWYRFSAPRVQSETGALSLYIPTARQNVAVYINDKWVGQGGSFKTGHKRVWHQPQLYQFPAELLNKDENVISVRLRTHRESSGYLSAVYVGQQQVTDAWQWRNWIKVDLLRFIAHFLIIVGLLNITMWGLRPKETFYLWYALAALVWGARCYLLLPSNLDLSYDLWTALRLTTLGWGVVFVLLFNLRFFGQKDRKVDFLLFLYCVPLALPMMFMSAEMLHGYGHQFWARMCVVIAAYTSFKLVQIYVRQGDSRAIMLLCTGIPLFVFGVYDLLVLNDHISPKNGFIINFASPPALILAMWFMFQRFSRSLDEAEELNITLDNRVKDKQSELASQYERQEELQRKQVLTEERERIMRDMHDGLGGHLIGLKALAENRDENPNIKRIQDHINHALIDLRFVINSLDRTSKTIPMLLGSMRKRWQQLCESKDIELNWYTANSDRELVLGPSKMLQTMRILEEAFSNVLKHSGATKISIAYTSNEEQHTIRVADNGRWMQNNSQGRGIANMHYRAEQIGAKILVQKSEEGSEVSLRIISD